MLAGGFVVQNNYDTIAEKLRESGLISLPSLVSEEVIRNEFNYFISKYKRSYSNDYDYENRYNIFRENYLMIENHNANIDKHGFFMRINHFADLTHDEYRATITRTPKTSHQEAVSPNPIGSFLKRNPTKEAMELNDLPKSVDWRDKGILFPVINQGNCSAGYAFSSIAAIEAIYRLKNVTNNKLSEQQIVDCADERFGNNGCRGGKAALVFDYVRQYDLCRNETYPYSGKDYATCYELLYCHTPYVISNHTVLNNTRTDLYTAIAQQPVAINVDAANDAWRFYGGGILKSGCTNETNHGVLAVGYGTQPLYWIWEDSFLIAKNSQGADWGEAGYIKISTNSENGPGVCNIYTDMSYPNV